MFWVYPSSQGEGRYICVNYRKSVTKKETFNFYRWRHVLFWDLRGATLAPVSNLKHSLHNMTLYRVSKCLKTTFYVKFILTFTQEYFVFECNLWFSKLRGFEGQDNQDWIKNLYRGQNIKLLQFSRTCCQIGCLN